VGKKIYVSTATGKHQQRTGGVIHVFSLESGNTMTLVDTHPITAGSYGYSCLAKRSDGLVLLYEAGPGEIRFLRIGNL